MKDGPMMTPIRAMLSKMNSTSPFSSAHAIADLGSGPGPVVAELILTHGASIPSAARLVARTLAPP